MVASPGPTLPAPGLAHVRQSRLENVIRVRPVRLVAKCRCAYFVASDRTTALVDESGVADSVHCARLPVGPVNEGRVADPVVRRGSAIVVLERSVSDAIG